MSGKKDAITIIKNGPYCVPAKVPLNKASIICDEDGVSERWDVSGQYDTGSEETYNLCRCGRSSHKPFCDGTHVAAEFRGAEHGDNGTYADRAKRYEGERFDMLDDRSLCVVARFCDKGDTIWKDIARTGDEAVSREVLREACACPGGRLTIVTKEGEALEPELPMEISLVEDPSRIHRGPLWVKGGIPIRGEGGETYEVRNRVALCRCGESANMPYCDATHYECPHMHGLDE